MWQILATDYQESMKPEVVAYFLEERDADDYIAYLATIDVVAEKRRIKE